MKAREHEEAAELQLFIESEREHKGARNGNGSKHRHKHAHAEYERKALDERGGEPEEYDRGDDVRDVAVADGEPCAGKALADSLLRLLAGRELFF